MNHLTCTSKFLRDLYNIPLMTKQSTNLPLPPELRAYACNLYTLHQTPEQILTNERQWICKYKLVTTRYRFRLDYYDEDDPDLLIDPIDDANYRRTWAICFEAYLRRQLIMLYNLLTDTKPMLKDVVLPIPVLYPLSSDPDNIHKKTIKIKSLMLNQPILPVKNIPSDYWDLGYWKLTWYTLEYSNEEIPSPKFRCRPALLNSMDCMSLLYENIKEPSLDLIIKVVYHLHPFRFVLPLTFLYDIFGGVKNISAVELFFPEQTSTKYQFPDKKVLADSERRTFFNAIKDRREQGRLISEQEVLWPRRAKAFLGGSSLSYMLGLTTDFNNLDIFIEYDAEVFAFIAFMIIYIHHQQS